MVTDKVIIAGKRCMLVMCNNVLNLLCNISVFIDTRKQWQWSVFRQSVVLSGFNMTWYTPHLRNLDFQDMSLFRSMILENNDNDLCFVNLLFCQVSIWLDIQSATTRMLLPTARKCIPLVRNTDNDLPLSRSFKSAAALRNTDNFENRIWF